MGRHEHVNPFAGGGTADRWSVEKKLSRWQEACPRLKH